MAADQVWNEIALPDPATLGWRNAAAEMATGVHAMLTRHSWLIQAFGSFLLSGTGKARHDDHSLAVFEAARITPREPTKPRPPSSPSCSATPSAPPRRPR